MEFPESYIVTRPGADLTSLGDVAVILNACPGAAGVIAERTTSPDVFDEAVARLRRAGADLDAPLCRAAAHAIHLADERLFRRALEHKKAFFDSAVYHAAASTSSLYFPEALAACSAADAEGVFQWACRTGAHDAAQVALPYVVTVTLESARQCIMRDWEDIAADALSRVLARAWTESDDLDEVWAAILAGADLVSDATFAVAREHAAAPRFHVLTDALTESAAAGDLLAVSRCVSLLRDARKGERTPNYVASIVRAMKAAATGGHQACLETIADRLEVHKMPSLGGASGPCRAYLERHCAEYTREDAVRAARAGDADELERALAAVDGVAFSREDVEHIAAHGHSTVLGAVLKRVDPTTDIRRAVSLAFAYGYQDDTNMALLLSAFSPHAAALWNAYNAVLS